MRNLPLAQVTLSFGGKVFRTLPSDNNKHAEDDDHHRHHGHFRHHGHHRRWRPTKDWDKNIV